MGAEALGVISDLCDHPCQSGCHAGETWEKTQTDMHGGDLTFLRPISGMHPSLVPSSFSPRRQDINTSPTTLHCSPALVKRHAALHCTAFRCYAMLCPCHASLWASWSAPYNSMFSSRRQGCSCSWVMTGQDASVFQPRQSHSSHGLSPPKKPPTSVDVGVCLSWYQSAQSNLSRNSQLAY